jgi:bifunctional UDP-N-acetylglucosamine pyrophosphorylase/glucosamine-1-phosphate N-acetyltransferase
MEAAGVNDRAQLAAAEAELRGRINERWMRCGVTMIDPDHVVLDTSVQLGEEVTLYPGVILEGQTAVEFGTSIGPNCHLVDTVVGARATVTQTTAHQAVIGDGAKVGPFAVLAPGTHLREGAVTGAFYDSDAPRGGEDRPGSGEGKR